MNVLSWIVWAIFGGGASYAAFVTILKNHERREFLPSTYGSLCILIAFIWSAFENCYIRLNLIWLLVFAVLINSVVISLIYPLFGKISPILSMGIFIWVFYTLTKYI